jgi:hypothetical protein
MTISSQEPVTYREGGLRISSFPIGMLGQWKTLPETGSDYRPAQAASSQRTSGSLLLFVLPHSDAATSKPLRLSDKAVQSLHGAC